MTKGEIMTEDKWYDLKENIREKFGILEEKNEPDIIEDDLGNQIKGEKETIVFNGPMGKMMLAKIKRPLIIDKKSHYHKTQAGKALTEFIVSDTESTIRVEAFTWNELTQDWEELDIKGDRISF